MGNDFELKVEKYDAESVEAKRKKIMRKILIGAGTVTVLAVLGYFGLRGGAQEQNNNTTTNRQHNNPATNRGWNGPEVVGGSGSWYASVVVHLEELDG